MKESKKKKVHLVTGKDKAGFTLEQFLTGSFFCSPITETSCQA